MSRRTLTERKKSGHFGRITYITSINQEIENALEGRKNLQVIDHYQDKVTNVTPKLIELDDAAFQRFRMLHTFVSLELRLLSHERHASGESLYSRRWSLGSVRQKSSMRLGMGLKLSLEDIIQLVGSMHMLSKDEDAFMSRDDFSRPTTHFRFPFIRVSLYKTNEFVLYEQGSTSVMKGTEDAEATEYDNRVYDYLTIGKGKIRRRSEAETQTKLVLTKTRDVNTIVKHFAERAAYVSFFEMFDTYQNLMETSDHSVKEKIFDDYDIIPDQLDLIARNPKFTYSAMVLERILAGNFYHQGQRRYRNMTLPSRMDMHADYKYTINLLYRLVQPVFEFSRISGKRRKAISAISFCYGNGDLLAVGYGFYSHSAKVTVPNGNVCIWSMKNPQNPERSYSYPVPVTVVEFSPYLPFLIAIGMYDGSVQVRNITKPHDPPVAISQRSSMLTSEPVTAIHWFRQPQGDDTAEIDPFLVLTRDGKITKFRIIASPYLLGMRQMELNRIEGDPEGLQIKTLEVTLNANYESNRHPCGLSLVMHPTVRDLYFILTDEGCIQKCSLNHTHQYLDVLKVHEGSVNYMDYSPWSPKLFLTCGNDWCIRIWLEGVFQPLITLIDRYAPVHCAMWSRTHSTVIIAINRETVDMWDLRRNLLAPVSSKKMDKSFQTLAKLSLCGRSLAIGNERGNILMCSFEDMPFQPHNQYAELEKAIHKAVETSPSLVFELKNIGYFGYEKKRQKKAIEW